MKKIFSIILIIFCIFSFNTSFFISPTFAENAAVNEVIDTALVNADKEDLLDQPVFEEEQAPPPIMNKFVGKLSSLIINILGGILLLVVVIICLSFIWFTNLQRKQEKKKKYQAANSNVINAVDNFARHRIKR